MSPVPSQELPGQVFAFCVWTTGTNQRLAPPKKFNYLRLLYLPTCCQMCSLASCPFIETFLGTSVLNRKKTQTACLGCSGAAQLCYDLLPAKAQQIFWIYLFSVCRRSKGTWISDYSDLPNPLWREFCSMWTSIRLHPTCSDEDTSPLLS